MRIHHVLAITSSTAFLRVNRTPSLILALHRLESSQTTLLSLSIAVDAHDAQQARDFLDQTPVNIEILICQPTKPQSLAEALEPRCGTVDAIMIQDASRPLTPDAQFEGVLAAFRDDIDAVRPAMPFTETLKILGQDSTIKETLDRSTVLRIATPELIRVSAIDREGPDCGWFLPLQKGARTLNIEGSPEGWRINTPADRDLIELHQN